MKQIPKVILWSALVAATALLMGGAVLYETLNRPLRDVRGTSSAFSSLTEKRNFLARYQRLPSEVIALEYEFETHDNGFAPSDWNFECLARVKPGDVSKWVGKRAKTLRSVDYGWVARLASRNPALTVLGSPTIYQFPGEACSYLIVYERESVVAKLETTLGCVTP